MVCWVAVKVKIILLEFATSVDVKALSILLGGIGREFFKEDNKKSIDLTPEESANSITKIILNGIKLEN